MKPVLTVATERYEIQNPLFHAPAITNSNTITDTVAITIHL